MTFVEKQRRREMMTDVLADLIEVGAVVVGENDKGENTYQLSSEFAAMTDKERDREWMRRLNILRAQRAAKAAR